MSESLVVPEAVVSTSALAVLSEAISIGPAGEGARILGERLDLPDERYLEVTLANAIYRKFHACQDDGSGALRPQRIAAFEQRLSEQIPVPEFEQSAVYLGASKADGMQETHSLVSIEGVKVCVENRSVISGRSNPVADSNILVNLPAARPAASPGFFYTLGAAASRAPKPLKTVRLYVNVTHAEHAPKAWGSVLAALESLGNRYSAKVLSDPAAYPRNDAIVAYVGDPRLDQIHKISYALSNASGVGTQTSVFAERIAPGMAIAEEPHDMRPTMRALSFGQHRSLLYARTLINSAQKGRDLDEELRYQLTAAGVDPARPAMNAAG